MLVLVYKAIPSKMFSRTKLPSKSVSPISVKSLPTIVLVVVNACRPDLSANHQVPSASFFMVMSKHNVVLAYAVVPYVAMPVTTVSGVPIPLG